LKINCKQKFKRFAARPEWSSFFVIATGKKFNGLLHSVRNDKKKAGTEGGNVCQNKLHFDIRGRQKAAQIKLSIKATDCFTICVARNDAKIFIFAKIFSLKPFIACNCITP
jgi:hypothetical protein